jgi:hypothetical protein
MSQRFSTVALNAQHGHTVCQDLWKWVKAMTVGGHRISIEAKPETRTTSQNRMLWSILGDLADQVQWPVDGKLQKLDADEWKHILSAGLKKHQRVAQGIEGGFVMLGQATSRMTVGEMADLITLAHAFGDERGVKWSKTSLGRDWPEEIAA